MRIPDVGEVVALKTSMSQFSPQVVIGLNDSAKCLKANYYHSESYLRKSAVYRDLRDYVQIRDLFMELGDMYINRCPIANYQKGTARQSLRFYQFGELVYHIMNTIQYASLGAHSNKMFNIDKYSEGSVRIFAENMLMLWAYYGCNAHINQERRKFLLKEAFLNDLGSIIGFENGKPMVNLEGVYIGIDIFKKEMKWQRSFYIGDMSMTNMNLNARFGELTDINDYLSDMEDYTQDMIDRLIHRKTGSMSVDKDNLDTNNNVTSNKKEKDMSKLYEVNVPATKDAKAFTGYGTYMATDSAGRIILELKSLGKNTDEPTIQAFKADYVEEIRPWTFSTSRNGNNEDVHYVGPKGCVKAGDLFINSAGHLITVKAINTKANTSRVLKAFKLQGDMFDSTVTDPIA